MNKDAILATIIGLILGLTISGVLIFGPSLLKALPKLKFPTISLPKSQKSQTTTPNTTPVPSEFTVTITAPLPGAIEPKKDIVVSGVTTAGATVVIQGPLDEDVIVAGADGGYAGKVTATEGKNDITVTAYADGKEAAHTIAIYYTEENF